MSWRDETGMSGPAGITDFEIEPAKHWNEKHIQLQNLCFQILRFIQDNPEVASEVTVTRDSIKSLL